MSISPRRLGRSDLTSSGRSLAQGALSALFAWVYNQTGRSILSAILMYLVFNLTANLLYPLSPQAGLIHAALLLICMVFILKLHKGVTVELS